MLVTTPFGRKPVSSGYLRRLRNIVLGIGFCVQDLTHSRLMYIKIESYLIHTKASTSIYYDGHIILADSRFFIVGKRLGNIKALYCDDGNTRATRLQQFCVA